MKKYNRWPVLIISLFLFSSNVFAQSTGLPEFKAGQYNPEGELITVKAKGLVCEFCAKALEKVFLRQKEVSGIHVNLTTKDILISLKSGQTLNDDVVNKLIKDSGYNVNFIEKSQNGGSDGAGQ